MSLRFAIVGCGAIAEDMHIPALKAFSGVDLVALVDSDITHARELAHRHGIGEARRAITELQGGLDAVVISTPPGVRPKLISEAFAMGLHVLAEKPLANSAAECSQINDACRLSKRSLAVSHMFRFYPVRARLNEIVAAHALGAIRTVEIHEGAPYAWSPRSGYTFKRGEVSGGVVLNAGVHSLDSLIQWFGEPVVESYEDDAVGGLESNARASLEFGARVQASFRISRTCRLQSVFRVGCEDGIVEFSNRDTVQYRIERAGSSSSHRLEGEGQTPSDCWRLQLQDFVDSIREGRRPQVDGDEAGRVVALVEQLYGMKKSRPLPSRALVPGATW